jgi:hypothetical protein
VDVQVAVVDVDVPAKELDEQRKSRAMVDQIEKAFVVTEEGELVERASAGRLLCVDAIYRVGEMTHILWRERALDCHVPRLLESRH